MADPHRVRIALAPVGTRGDCHPLLALGESWRGLGHDVVVCGPPDFRAEMEARGFEFRAVGTDVRAFLNERAAVMTGSHWKVFRESGRYMLENLAAQFRDLPEAAAGTDCIIGAGVQLAGPSAAERLGIPYRYVIYCPMLLPSEEHPPPQLPGRALPGWLNRQVWRAALALFDRQLGPELNRARAALGLAPVRGVIWHLLGERPVLAADRELAPLPADCPVAVDQTRCLHPFDGEPLPAKLESFLEQGPPPVYFGFGSMPDPDPMATTDRLLEAIRLAGCRALVSEGWAGLGEGPLPEDVFRLGSVSHARLFPRVAAVVHHGGAGTTTTAARAGVPQILIPHVLDQFYWARRVCALGLGPPPLPRRSLDARRLAATLEATLGNEVLAERAAEIGERLRRPDPSIPDPTRLLLGL